MRKSYKRKRKSKRRSTKKKYDGYKTDLYFLFDLDKHHATATRFFGKEVYSFFNIYWDSIETMDFVFKFNINRSVVTNCYHDVAFTELVHNVNTYEMNELKEIVKYICDCMNRAYYPDQNKLRDIAIKRLNELNNILNKRDGRMRRKIKLIY